MKYTYLLMVASFCLLAGCSQMERDFADVNSLTDGDLIEKVIFDVLPIKDGDDPETKASAVPNGGTVGFIWEATDTVGIYPDKGSQVYFNIEDGVCTNSVSFNGGGWALKQNSTYTSYYPFVGDIYLKRDKIPVSFAGQKQIGTSSPFVGARYFLATGASTSENGVLRFSYSTLNTIINVNATLPAGTYTKMSLTTEEPLFVEEGTYSLDDRVIIGTKFTNTLEIDLESVVLTEEATIPIYIMSAPVDLKGKEVTVKVISSDGKRYVCVKTPSKAYEAGTRYGLTCDKMEAESQPKNVIYYTSSNEDVISVFESAFDVRIVSNKYVEGLGIITFDGDVTSIGDYAFSDNTLITSMTIPGGVTSIGVGAFNYCSSLTSINLPKSVRSIGAWAFSECTSLTESITIPESMTSIGIGAFCDCRSLSSFKGKYASSDGVYLIVDGSIIAVAGGAIGGEVIIPEGVTSIGGYSFEGYTTFTSVSFPEGFTSIGEYAFCLCTGLVALTIPGAVTSIGYRAFYKCSSLANLTISEGITSIGNDAFYDCTSLANFTIPESVTSIGNNAFHGCTSLASLTIPENVMSIGNDAFYDCTSLANLTMFEGVTNIGSYAFCGCTSLTSITIPESVTSIGSGAFSRCYSISSFKGKYSSDDGLFLIDSGEIIAIAYAAFQDNVIIPNGVTAIGGGAFSGCTSLTSITIPESVTSIGGGAFSGCTSLTSITIPEGVTSIGISAFLGCSSLTSVIALPVMPPQCGSNAFSGTNNCPIFVPAEGIEAYLSAKEWSRYADRIQAIAPLPEAVDLGLPSGVKWASFNLGASKPEGFGYYYAWGETETKKVYDESTYKWCNCC